MSAIDQLRKNLGTAPAPSLANDLNKKGTTQPVTTAPKTGGAIGALRANLNAPAPTAPAKQTPVADTNSAWGSYVDGANRVAGSFTASLVESAGQLLRSAQWASDRVVGTLTGQKIDTIKSPAITVQDKTKEWGQALRSSAGITPENQTFFNKVVEGAGSSAIYFIPGVGIAKGASVLTKVSPKIATIFGGSASAGLEAMAEAGQVFDQVKKTDGFDKANESATKTFMANAILLAVTNHVGIFNPEKIGVLKRALISAPTEGLQEAVQQIIQNKETGQPLWQGVLESGIIGGIIGTGMGTVVDAVVIPPKERVGGGSPEKVVTGDSPALTALRSKISGTPAIQQQKALEQGVSPVSSPVAPISGTSTTAPKELPQANVQLPEQVQPVQKDTAYKAFEDLASRVTSIEDLHKAINEADIANLEDVIQFHGSQSKEFSTALKEGTVRVSEDGVIGKGFYVTSTPETADYFGKQVKSGNARENNGGTPDIYGIDLRDLNIKKLPYGKGEYYDFLKSEKLSPNEYNAKLQQEGYDGLNLEGRGETVIFNSSKIKGFDLNTILPAQKKAPSEIVRQARKRFDDSFVPNGMETNVGEIKQEVKGYIKGLEESGELEGLDFEIVDMEITGSRSKGVGKKTSDLDLLLEFKGEAREDDLFNALNDKKLKIEGVEIDINPIKKERSGTIDEYIKTNEQETGKYKTEKVVKESKRIGLMDYDPSYTDHMKELIKTAQENGDSFPYLKMTKEEQDIVDRAFRKGMESFTQSPTESKTPKDGQEASDIYWEEVIQPAIDKGEAVVIGADDMKDHFGKDYNDANHPVYSRGAFLTYERALKEVPGDVFLTAGGAGSGKTEVIVKTLLESGFTGIIYDSNLANFEGASKQIAMAKESDRNVDIYGITPDLESARKFTIIRENEKGRGISDSTFARGHAGFPNVIAKLLEEKIVKPGEVHILDTRSQTTLEQAKEMVRNGSFVKNPLAYVKKLGYTEANVKTSYAKDSFSKTGNERLQGKELSKQPNKSPSESGANKVSPKEEVGGKKSGLHLEVQEVTSYDTLGAFLKAQGTPVYHGTLENFDTFTNEKIGSNTEWDNAKFGIFFLDSKEDASAFPDLARKPGDDRAVIVKEAYLDLKNPLDLTIGGILNKESQASLIVDLLGGDPIKDNKKALASLNENIGLGEIADVMEEIYRDVGNKKLMQDAGYDGIISNYGGDNIREKVVFDASQIKTREQLVDIYNKEHSKFAVVQGVNFPRYGYGRNEAFAPKPPLSKTELKRLIQNTPEFKKNPILTVEESPQSGKVLAFHGKTATFGIKPRALGLNGENLEIGDQIKVSLKTLSRSGQEFRVIKYDEKTGQGSAHASVGRYRDDTEMFLGNPDSIKAIQFPELVGLAKELMGNVPFIKKYTKANGMFYGRGNGEIGLNPKLFEKENLGQLTKTLSHEIGHLIDYLPDQTMKRGNLMGRLNTLREFRKDFFQQAGQSRTNKALREEMYELSKYWRPYDEATASTAFKTYRKSSDELYADFISALFNDPRLVSNMAPEAYNIFFQQLDNKPNAKQAYFELQDFLRNGDLVASRRSATKEMFKVTEQEARERQIQNQIEQDQKEKSVWFKFKTEAVDITEVVKQAVKTAKENGTVLNDDENPTYYLEARNYLGGKIKSEIDTKFNSIYQELQKEGMTWEDMGELMMYERILKGDRQEVANPLGYQPDFVQDLMEVYEDVGRVKSDPAQYEAGTSDMKSTLGEDKFRKLQTLAVEYRENLKSLFQEGRTEGIYSEELSKMFEDNAFYVPFKGAKYSGVTRTTFGVKAQKGTLGNIENPANTGIEKAVSIIRAIERNKVTRKVIEFYKQNFPEEVTEASNDKNGYPLEPKEPDLDLVTYMEDGKVKGYYVDSYIAEAIKKTPSAKLNQIVGALRFMNSGLFRPAFITFNLGFQAFNTIRDFKRFWKNVPNMTLTRAFSLYAQSARASKIRAFGLPKNPSAKDIEAYNLINRLEKEQVISITYNDIIKGESLEDAQIERIMREVGVREVKDTKLGKLGEKIGISKETPIIKQAFQILDFIEKTGNLIETLPKVAGVKALEGKLPPNEMRSFVRKYVGSPDFMAGGRDKKSMNEIFLFSNAIFQGIRSDYEIATDPKSRGAFWLKTAQSEILPKILMLMATAGLFGEYLKELFAKIGEYDKTNYTIIPLGEDENGKAIYFRMPSDETGKLLGGVFWKGVSVASDVEKLKEFQTYLDLVNYAGGQAPGLTPIATAGANLTQFLAGNNPYDFFRGRPVLTDDQQLAGGSERLKPFLSYMFQQLGGGVFVKLYYNETVPKNPSLSEKITNLPLISNIAGRFIKTSNYGEVEKIREITNQVRSDQANERIANRKVVFDYVDQAKGKPYAEAQALKREMIQEVYGGFPKTPADRTQAQNLAKRFDTLLIRGTADARVDSLVTALSNEEKVALLQEYKTTMTPEAYDELKRFIIKNRVVSSAVFQALNAGEKNK